MDSTRAIQAATDTASAMFGSQRDAWVQDERLDGSVDVVVDSGSLDATRVWRVAEDGQVELLSRYVDVEEQ